VATRILVMLALAASMPCFVGPTVCDAATESRNVVDDSDEDKLKRAKELFKLAQTWESNQEFEKAADCYLEIQKIFPKNADVYYNLAICQQKIGRTEDAIGSFKSFLQSDVSGPDREEARSRLAELLIPKEHREAWIEASLTLQVAGKAVPNGVDEENSGVESGRRAVSLLSDLKRKLRSDSQASSAIERHLGFAYHMMGNFQRASDSYKAYLNGPHALDYSNPDITNIRRRKIECDTKVDSAIGKQQANARKVADEQAKKKAVEEAEEAVRTKRSHLVELGKSEFKSGPAKIRQSIGLEDVTLVNTYEFYQHPENLMIQNVTRIKLSDIDINSIELRDVTPANSRQICPMVFFWAVERGNKFRVQSMSRGSATQPMKPSEQGVNHSSFLAPDSKIATEIANTLRALVEAEQRGQGK
jgi:tetratricopeptide (TPR) repeat protein